LKLLELLASNFIIHKLQVTVIADMLFTYHFLANVFKYLNHD